MGRVGSVYLNVFIILEFEQRNICMYVCMYSEITQVPAECDIYRAQQKSSTWRIWLIKKIRIDITQNFVH